VVGLQSTPMLFGRHPILIMHFHSGTRPATGPHNVYTSEAFMMLHGFTGSFSLLQNGCTTANDFFGSLKRWWGGSSGD
jgi:hypothetical protein